jgi:hypothetical protein
MFNHSPKPNVNFIRRAPTSKSPDVSPAMVFMTSRPVRKGEELFICYGQESKLWFSPDYGKAEEETQRGYEEEVAESADAFLSGFDGLVETDEAGDIEQETTTGPHVTEAAELPEAVVQTPLEPPTAALATSEDLFGELSMTEEIPENQDEEKRARRQQKKALQDEKTAKYQQKKAVRKAGKTAAPAQSEVQLAPPIVVAAQTQPEEPSYQGALQLLDLAPAITVTSEDVDAINAEEMGRDAFEGDFGFAGWRSVKRVPGLSEGGEPALDSTRKSPQ